MANKKDIQIHDEILSDSLNFLRLTAGVQKKILKEFKILKKNITKSLNKDVLTEYKKSELKSLLKEVNFVISDHYKKVEEISLNETTGLSSISSKSTIKHLDNAFLGVLDIKIPTQNVLELLAKNTLIQGHPQKAWWKKQDSDTKFRYQAAVRHGVMSGWANGPIIRNVRNGLEVSQNHASALVHTSIQTVSNEARLKTFEENDDIIKGLEWVATLDGHTCVLCIPRDGKQWKLDGNPIGGHGIRFQNPPIHFNDRCVLVPVTKTFKELGIDIDELPEGERPSADGIVSSKVKFDEFLRRKGKDFQNKSLGKGRAELWRKNKITTRDLINGNGKELTLKEISDSL